MNHNRSVGEKRVEVSSGETSRLLLVLLQTLSSRTGVSASLQESKLRVKAALRFYRTV